MLASYHTHSHWSDGKQSLAQMLDAAIRQGIGELGVSDHWALHPSGERMTWAMPPDALAEYVRDVLALRDQSQKQGGPVIRLGLEVDWYPKRSDSVDPAAPLRAHLDQFPFDYLIGSVHEVNGFTIDGSPAGWRKLPQSDIDRIHRHYWRNMKSLAQSNLFDIVAHIDLAKKFDFHASCDLSREINEALDAIASSPNKPVVELNTAGWHKPCNDAYPSLDILRGCHARGIDVTMSADAHQPEHLLRDFDKAALRLADAGYSRVARFENRRRRFETLASATPMIAGSAAAS